MSTKTQILSTLGISGLIILLVWGLDTVNLHVMPSLLMAGAFAVAYGHAFVGLAATILLLHLVCFRHPLMRRAHIWAIPIIVFLHGVLLTAWELRQSLFRTYDWCVGGGHGGWRLVLADTSLGVGLAASYLMVSAFYTLCCIALIIVAHLPCKKAQPLKADPPFPGIR